MTTDNTPRSNPSNRSYFLQVILPWILTSVVIVGGVLYGQRDRERAQQEATTEHNARLNERRREAWERYLGGLNHFFQEAEARVRTNPALAEASHGSEVFNLDGNSVVLSYYQARKLRALDDRFGGVTSTLEAPGEFECANDRRIGDEDHPGTACTWTDRGRRRWVRWSTWTLYHETGTD
jgi:hypothetical protein